MSKYGIPAFLILLTLFLSGQAWSASRQVPKAAANNHYDASTERIGGLGLGLSEKVVQASISCPQKKLKEIFEGATGDFVQTWLYPQCGIVLKMSSRKKGGAKTISAITITAASTFSTSRGIHLGSTEKEVLEAYGKYRDHDGATKKGKRFVAGSIYDGLDLDFKDGKVVRIFLGAAAE